MMTSRSPIDSVLSVLSGLEGVEVAPKVVTKKGLLYVAKSGHIQIRFMPAMASSGFILVLDDLGSDFLFSVGLGGAIQRYGFVERHTLFLGEDEIEFFTLPGGAYFEEFRSAFASDQAKQRLLTLYETKLVFGMNNEQIEFFMPIETLPELLSSVISKALHVASNKPYLLPDA